jgi:hypothetical protein
MSSSATDKRPLTVGDFVHVSGFANAPDIYVNSVYDPVRDEVAAFEELADLLDERGRLRGADTVHRQLVRWLERLGHRQDLTPDAVAPVPLPVPLPPRE